MSFSWKEGKLRIIKKLKKRREIYLKAGQSDKANDVKRRIERMQKDAT